MKKILKKIICFFIGHDWIYWDEPIDHLAIEIEFKRCERCQRFDGVVDVKPQ